MNTLRIIGDVHGQFDRDSLCKVGCQPYQELIFDAPFSVQVGDMGDGETYEQLEKLIDKDRHRFFAGNHEKYDKLPPHCLGDFGSTSLGGVKFFFVRGAASTDKKELVQLGRKLGRKLWFEEEELTDDQMLVAENEYVRARPEIVLSHDAPADIARFAWQHATRMGPPNPGALFRPSRTNEFLSRLLDQHAPKLWIFGHHHCDWSYREMETTFVCVGVLSFVDIDSRGELIPDGL